jgi:hypothetical protein
VKAFTLIYFNYKRTIPIKEPMLADITRELRECRHELQSLMSEPPTPKDTKKMDIASLIESIRRTSGDIDTKQALSGFIRALHDYYTTEIKIIADAETRNSELKWAKEKLNGAAAALPSQWKNITW